MEEFGESSGRSDGELGDESVEDWECNVAVGAQGSQIEPCRGAITGWLTTTSESLSPCAAMIGPGVSDWSCE